MKIAIIGYGKMGKMVERTALDQGHTVTALVDPVSQDSNPPIGAPSGAKMFPGIAAAGNLCGAEVAIEFTQPSTALANIKALAEKRIPSVIGTTGWYDQLDEARRLAEQAGAALIYASNFSLGVNMFYRIAWHAAQLADSFPEYDVGGFESHHNKKLDSPSGTAKTLVEGALARMKRKDKAVWETLDRCPQSNELHYPSLRLGSIPGQHSLIFDSPADTIEIIHTARSREGFASGAVRAAQWLLSPGTANARAGVFTIDDMLKDLLG